MTKNKRVTVGILSDSHGFLHTKIAEVVNQCDYILHAGDIFNAHILEQLKPKKQLLAVSGNNDYPALWSAEEADIVNALPERAELDVPGGLIVMEHGHRLGNHPEHERLRSDHAQARMVVYGHTHRRVIDQQSEPWVINPGASGKIRTHGGPSCLVLFASEAEWKIDTFLFKEG